MDHQNLYSSSPTDTTKSAKTFFDKSLSHIDLRGTVLKKIELSGANLFKAHLGNTDLREANLSDANLSGADLSGADLRKANLRKADLHKADLFKANLRNADLSGANLCEAKLSRADLSGADLRKTNFNKAHLSKVNLSRAELSGIDLSDANLTQATLSNLDLSGAELSGANLTGANLSGSDLSGADLSRTILRYAILSKTDLRCSNLREANLTGTDLRTADLFGADLGEADLSGSNLQGTNLGKTNIQGSFLKDGIGLSMQEIQDLKERGAIFESSLNPRDRKTLLAIYSLNFIEDDNASELGQFIASEFYLDSAAVQMKRAESDKVSSLLFDIFEEAAAVSGLSELEPNAFDESENLIQGLDSTHTRFLRILLQQPIWSRDDLESKAAELNLLLDGVLEVINDVAFDMCDEPLTDGNDPIKLDANVLEQLLS